MADNARDCGGRERRGGNTKKNNAFITILCFEPVAELLVACRYLRSTPLRVMARCFYCNLILSAVLCGFVKKKRKKSSRRPTNPHDGYPFGSAVSLRRRQFYGLSPVLWA